MNTCTHRSLYIHLHNNHEGPLKKFPPTRFTLYPWETGKGKEVKKEGLYIYNTNPDVVDTTVVLR